MSIQRVPKVPFAQIANEALRDVRLSFKARGILALVLSHSGEWTANARWLESQSNHDGRAAIQSALNELTELGYRSVGREQLNGEIRTVVVWRHHPEVLISRPTENLTVRKSDHQESGPSLEHHQPEHNLTEHNQEREDAGGDDLTMFEGEGDDGLTNPRGVSLTHVGDVSRTGSNETRGAQVEPARGRDTDTFDVFWTTYPRRVARAHALRAYSKAIKKVSPEVIIQAAAAYRDDPNRDDQFTKHPTTWLNGECWNDEALPDGKMQRRATAGESRMNLYANLYEQINGRKELNS
jgi:hypothetical protein